MVPSSTNRTIDENKSRRAPTPLQNSKWVGESNPPNPNPIPRWYKQVRFWWSSNRMLHSWTTSWIEQNDMLWTWRGSLSQLTWWSLTIECCHYDFGAKTRFWSVPVNSQPFAIEHLTYWVTTFRYTAFGDLYLGLRFVTLNIILYKIYCFESVQDYHPDCLRDVISPHLVDSQHSPMNCDPHNLKPL